MRIFVKMLKYFPVITRKAGFLDLIEALIYLKIPNRVLTLRNFV